MSEPTAQEVMHRAETERQLQAKVVHLARTLGWRVHVVWNSQHSPAGWPDVVACKDDRMLALELKSERGRLSQAQMDWLDALDAVPGITARCARPSDWDELVQLFGDGVR